MTNRDSIDNRPTYGAVVKNTRKQARSRSRDNDTDICIIRSWLEHRPVMHWWIIEGQHGDTSTGKCRYCTAEKTFANSSYGDKLNNPDRRGVTW